MIPRMDRMGRHIAACNSARLPGGRLPFRIGAARIGWVQPPLARVLVDFRGIRMDGRSVVLAEDAAGELPAIAQTLAQAGHLRWRGEAFDVRAAEFGTVLTTIDRGALPAFGLLAAGVHLNGLVRRDGAWWLWVGRRAADKALDPGKLDHIVAGGVPAGLSPWATLLKEAEEEAALPARLLARAREVARIGYAMERPEGLRRDRLICYDVILPDDFEPFPTDGEVVGFELWPLSRAVAAVRDTDAFKFNVNIVLMDLFHRLRVDAR